MSCQIIVTGLTHILNVAASLHKTTNSLGYINYFFVVNKNQQITVIFGYDETALEYLKSDLLLSKSSTSKTLVTIGILRVDFNKNLGKFHAPETFIPMLYRYVEFQEAVNLFPTIPFSALCDVPYEWTTKEMENCKDVILNF